MALSVPVYHVPTPETLGKGPVFRRVLRYKVGRSRLPRHIHRHWWLAGLISWRSGREARRGDSSLQLVVAEPVRAAACPGASTAGSACLRAPNSLCQTPQALISQTVPPLPDPGCWCLLRDASQAHKSRGHSPRGVSVLSSHFLQDEGLFDSFFF